MTKEISSPSERKKNSLVIETIAPLAQEINCLDMKKITDICVKQIPKLIDARLASLYIIEDQTDMLCLQGHNHPFLINNIVSLNQHPAPPMVTAARTKKLLHVDDIETYSKPLIRKNQRQFAQNYEKKCCIIAPLICQGRVVGVLNLADKLEHDRFNSDDIATIELFRQLLGSSIGNIKLFGKIQHQARTDGLTGLANHRTFYDLLEKEQRRIQRYGGQISLIMADIDNLKPINDKQGHRAGDLAIRHVSKKIKDCIREIDTAARYGGDEFAIILPNTSLADAIVVANRMVREISESVIRWEGQELKMSVSIGVGQYDSDFNPEEITKSVDAALYSAKKAGKNKVSVCESEKACI